MKTYKGNFKDINNNSIYVEILPTGVEDLSSLENVDLNFTYEEPVIIEQTSDGIFSPIKSKSCTITIFTEDILWELYTENPTGYYVHVYNSSESLFDGYLTPCVYTQEYAYKGELELEAVDFLATIDNYEYHTDYYYDNTPRVDKCSIIKVSDLLNKLFEFIPQYDGYDNRTNYDLGNLYLQESNFFDDDDEPMTCKEILDELLRYLGCTALMKDGKVYIIDYNNSMKTTQVQLDKDLYGEGTPTVDLDDVYRKIRFGVNLYEVEDLFDDIFDDEGKTFVNEFKVAGTDQIYADYTFSFRKWYHHTEDKHRYHMLIKPYMFVNQENADGKKYKTSRWKTYNRKVEDQTLENVTLTNKAGYDTTRYFHDGKKLFVPRYSGAYPVRQYVYNKQEGKASKNSINWEEMILFPVSYTVDGCYRNPYPALTFNNDNEMSYSMQSGTGYLLFNADLWYQCNLSLDGGPDKDIIWTEGDLLNLPPSVTIPVPVCYSNMDLTFDNQNGAKREKDNASYNKGWKMVKAQLRIGNKYWNGSAWTTTNTTFDINYHDDDVIEDDETFTFFTWLKPVSTGKKEIGEEGYAIPVKPSDNLYGDLEFTLYTPYQFIPYNFVISGQNANNFFMRDLSLKYIYSDSSAWGDDTTTDEDIIYEYKDETEPFPKSLEMPEIDLKINSWYYEKPMSKSYMLDSNKKPVVTLNGRIQEERLCEKYWGHYSTTKRIFSLNYKLEEIDPLTKYSHTDLDDDTTTKLGDGYILDSYEMDVKSGETNIKLIEL